jgi:hypothetical protein
MTEFVDPRTPTDLRRAAALIVHHSRQDVAGINSILIEAGEENRNSELLLALLHLYQALMPHVHTELGLRLLEGIVLDLAAGEEQL